jgi:hypothetical protein
MLLAPAALPPFVTGLRRCEACRLQAVASRSRPGPMARYNAEAAATD